MRPDRVCRSLGKSGPIASHRAGGLPSSDDRTPMSLSNAKSSIRGPGILRLLILLILPLPVSGPATAGQPLATGAEMALEKRLPASATASIARLQEHLALLQAVNDWLDHRSWPISPPAARAERLALIATALAGHALCPPSKTPGGVASGLPIDADRVVAALGQVDPDDVLVDRFETNTARALVLQETWQASGCAAVPPPTRPGEPAADRCPAAWAAAFGRQVDACLTERQALDWLATGGAVDRAIADLDTALNLDPDYAGAWLSRGGLRLGRGDLETAIEDFTQALRLAPEDFRAYINRGIALRRLNHPGAALADYHQALAIAPQDPRVHVNIGNIHADAGRYEAAITRYDEAIRLAPDNAAARFNRGRVLCDLARYPEAIADLGQAIGLHPGYLKAHLKRAEALERTGDFTGALADYSTAITLAPDRFEGYLRRGDLHERMGSFAEARDDFDAAVRRAPNRYESYHRRGRVNGMLGHPDEEMHDYALALEKGAGAAVYTDRGWAYGARGDMDLALADFERALNLEPDSARALMGRAMVHHENRRFQQAIDDYSRAIVRVPTLAQAYLSRGNAYAEIRDYEKALADYARTISLAPDNPDGYLNRGRIHVLEGRYEMACQEGRRACERGDCSTYRLARRRGYCK